jgi:hypothetical protein
MTQVGNYTQVGNHQTTGSVSISGSMDIIGNTTLSGSAFISGSVTIINGENLVTHTLKALGSNGFRILANNNTVIATMGEGGGSQANFTGSLSSTQFTSPSITGSLLGTASYAANHATVASSYICSGILSVDQTFATGSDFIIPFVDQYDSNNWLSGSRFTPTIAGYYHLEFGIWLNNPGVSDNQANAQMRKNGNSWVLVQNPLNSVTGQSLAGSRVIYLNGTTDYVDWTIYQATGNTNTGTILKGTADGSGTWFSAFLVTQ